MPSPAEGISDWIPTPTFRQSDWNLPGLTGRSKLLCDVDMHSRFVNRCKTQRKEREMKEEREFSRTDSQSRRWNDFRKLITRGAIARVCAVSLLMSHPNCCSLTCCEDVSDWPRNLFNRIVLYGRKRTSVCSVSSFSRALSTWTKSIWTSILHIDNVPQNQLYRPGQAVHWGLDCPTESPSVLICNLGPVLVSCVSASYFHSLLPPSLALLSSLFFIVFSDQVVLVFPSLFDTFLIIFRLPPVHLLASYVDLSWSMTSASDTNLKT